MDFIPNEIDLALQIADNIKNIADNGISYKQLTLSGDVLLQCHNKTVIALGELNSVVLPYLKTHKPDIYSIVKKNRDSLLRDMREVKEIAEQGNKMQWPDKVQNSLRNLAKALRASSGKAGDVKKSQSNGGKLDSPNEKSSETWYWKLYEKTIKAVIAAILDKVNPS